MSNIGDKYRELLPQILQLDRDLDPLIELWYELESAKNGSRNPLVYNSYTIDWETSTEKYIEVEYHDRDNDLQTDSIPVEFIESNHDAAVELETARREQAVKAAAAAEARRIQNDNYQRELRLRQYAALKREFGDA